jgi:DNA-binding CsgD family transcriptional regulator
MRIDDDGLLQALHAGMFEAPLWGDFLARLLAKSGAASVSLHMQGSDGSDPLTLHAGLPIQGAPSGNGMMRPGRAYALEELSELAESQPLPDGATHLRSIRVSEPGGINLWLSVAGGRSIGSSTSALLTTLAPHFAIALRTFATLGRERFRASVTEQAIERLKLGWLTVDSQCQIIETTSNIEPLFQWGTLLRRGRYDRLLPVEPVLDRQLTALVKSFGKGEGRAQAFRLSEDPWVDMLVTPAHETGLAGNRRVAAIIYISGDRRSQADRCEQLVDLFGLLPSEARLAWMLAQATSIADAAEALGLTIETARNYSKKIYAKTGARGHAELVRIVLTSALTVG